MSVGLIPDDLLQRRLDVLGIVQGVSLDSLQALQTTTIFTTGNIAFPASSGKKTIVAYVIVTTSDGLLPQAGTFFQIGSNGSNDWLGGANYNLGFAGWIYPIILTPQIAQQIPSTTTPAYPPGTLFTATNQSTVTPQPRTATFTAVGWSY